MLGRSTLLTVSYTGLAACVVAWARGDTVLAGIFAVCALLLAISSSAFPRKEKA